MDWMNQISGLLQQYAGSPDTSQSASHHASQNSPHPSNARSPYPPDTVEDDFDQVARAAPSHALSSGLADAFRSPQTPPFPQMLAQLFNQSNGQQRANLVNTLLGAAGPNALSQIANRSGAASAATAPTITSPTASAHAAASHAAASHPAAGTASSPPAASWVDEDTPGTSVAAISPTTPVTPAQAQQLPAQWVEEVATHAEQENPSIIEHISDFYAEQPALVKTLGGMALAVALARMSNSLADR
ncbi:MAG: hypothetical protein JWN98_675 [Abditibacteriota bacterium]|nr:hypothetical protein [Abditibacteriota bacterium]